MGNGKSTETIEDSNSQGCTQEGAAGGVISIMNSPAVQCFSFSSPGERKTWLKGALASVLDRVGYFTCFI